MCHRVAMEQVSVKKRGGRDGCLYQLVGSVQVPVLIGEKKGRGKGRGVLV
jgi:hypothetical protein